MATNDRAARDGHEQEFRATWELHPEISNDPYER